MNWVDFFLVLVILLSVLIGWRRGFIRGFLDLVTWGGTLVLAYVFYPYTAEFIRRVVNLNVWLLPVAFLLTALVARVLFSVVERVLLRTIPERVNQNRVNRAFGIIPGAINGWVYAVILSAILLALPLKKEITLETRDSQLAGKLAMQSEWANEKLAPVFDDAIRQTINSLTVQPSSEETVTLNFKFGKAQPRPDLEARMLEMVNYERKRYGLPALKPDPEMTGVARAHSRDMFEKGYFAHVNLEGQDPFDRMKAANVRFRAAGENLALAQTLEIAHKNLMNSPGHRANILNPAYGRLGIGVLDGGFYGLMISQEFRN
ncbi:MAG TPA: CvpA family protein [Chitinophagaceae bacterium]|nr:CvpA family protein [Chitinophagaceae bacterium]